MYKAQEVLVEYSSYSARERNIERSLHTCLLLNLQTFTLLWKAHQYPEAQSYALLCSEQLTESRYSLPVSATGQKSSLNLHGLVVMAVAGCAIRVEKDREKAESLLQTALQELSGQRLPVVFLISTMLSDIQSLKPEEPKKGALRLLEYVQTI